MNFNDSFTLLAPSNGFKKLNVTFSQNNDLAGYISIESNTQLKLCTPHRL